MKKKTGIYLVIGIVSIALALSARFLLQDCLSDSQSGAMIGIGAGLFGYGIAKWCVALWGAKNPDLMKINEIGRCLGMYFFRRTHMDCSYSCRRFPAENNP